MKKIITLILTFTAASLLYAQNAEYTALVKKAKESESKKLYASALAYYYDAYNADLSQKDSEDMQHFIQLGKTINDGNPGFGEYDEFSLYDDWVVLLKDFERYWTENPPIGVQFDALEKGNIDRANRTVSYSVKTWYGYSPKATYVVSKLIGGLDKVRRDDWDGVSYYWPHVSVYQNEVAKDGIYFRDGVALFRAPYDWHASTEWDLSDRITPASFSMGIIWDDRYNGKILFEFQLALVDENGNVLAKSNGYERFDDSWNDGYGYHDIYTFSGISPEIMKIIDAGNIKIVITKATLRYGKTTVRQADYLNEEWGKLQIKEYNPSSIYINKKGKEPILEGK